MLKSIHNRHPLWGDQPSFMRSSRKVTTSVTCQTPDEIAALALEEKIDVIPLSRYCHKKHVSPRFEIGFGGVDGKSITEGVQILPRMIPCTAGGVSRKPK